MPLLTVDDLSVTFTQRGERDVHAVDGVSFTVDEGQVVGLVGESGCGKSVTSLALMGLLPSRGVRVGGAAHLRLNGGSGAGTPDDTIPDQEQQGSVDLLAADARRMRDLRGSQIAMVFQDPLSSLNPVVPLGLQVTEILTRHQGLRGEAARTKAAELLERVGIPDPRRRLREYPHQQSGGIRQRALIAMAVACRPRLMIADEPTTALDVTIQAQILELLKDLVHNEGTALLMITHDLGVVAGLCDGINVLYAGRVVEAGPRSALFAAPTHPYSVGLLHSIPRLDAPRGEPLTPIRGSINDNIAWNDGCAFAPRCDRYTEACLEGPPELRHRSGEHLHRCVHPVGEGHQEGPASGAGPAATSTMEGSG
ncbi:ABC transporter ATP-binding protein [Lipingzhangella sp. LS1_29]|uniref:ABC transporter ATP-binding protein n=1 Tax=Lipingzhangella rawalii TaxID=2055835 RepID=A0ABU2H5L7_9ACTN|nr:ABC transporter ATP-binding protein [Lipingzhangella rawalii]MDS1270593.1 ABC transporter ATP-binding protein [Lipingzhangella rawalii]